MVVKFGDLRSSGSKNGRKEGFEYVSAKSIVGKKIRIVDVDIFDGKFGETAAIYMDNNKYFMSTSRIILEQVKKIILPAIQEGEVVETTLIQAVSKRGIKYYTFA